MDMKAKLNVLLSERGMKSRLAKELGITSQAVGQWDRVPAERVHAVARITGAPLHELRPDLFPPPTVAQGGEQQP